MPACQTTKTFVTRSQSTTLNNRCQESLWILFLTHFSHLYTSSRKIDVENRSSPVEVGTSHTGFIMHPRWFSRAGFSEPSTDTSFPEMDLIDQSWT